MEEKFRNVTPTPKHEKSPGICQKIILEKPNDLHVN